MRGSLLFLRSGSATTAAAGQLNGRARDRTVGAEDAAVAGLWPKQRVAGGTFVEIEARVGRHDLELRKAAMRTGEDGFETGYWLHCVASTWLPRLHRPMRKRKPSACPYCAGFVNRSTNTPPLAKTTRCDAKFPGSVVISTYGRPSARACGKIRPSAKVA